MSNRCRRFSILMALALLAVMLTATIACEKATKTQLSNQPFQQKRVWTHYMPHVPDFNMEPSNPYFQPNHGALYPLELTSSEKTSRNIDPIGRLQQAGINGLQILTYGSEDPSSYLEAWMSQADRYPGFAVAPCIAVDTEDQAVRLGEIFASLAAKHVSAAKENGKLVIFTFSSRDDKSPQFWRNVRNRLSSKGINTFLVNDTGAGLAVNGGLKPELLTPYFPVFDASYMFDDRTPKYWNEILSLFNQYNHAYAGGVMPGANRETPNGGYTDARATEHYRQDWELGLNAGLKWQTTVTWNDVVEHTEIRPTSDWNWTRADLTAFYSAKLRGTAYPKISPQLYVTTPQWIHLGKAPYAEGLVLNSSGSTMTVKLQLLDGNDQPYGNVLSASVPANSAGAVSIPDNSTLGSLPARRFLRAKASMYDSAGKLVQQVTSAPILIYSSSKISERQGRTLYYSIPAAKALPGTVQLSLNGSPVKAGGSAKATVTWINDTSSSSSNTTSTGQITLYEHSNFQGKSQSFGTGIYRADRGQLNTVGNDNISSLKVPAGLKVRLCEHESGGLCRNYNSGEHAYVEDDLNDETSYIEVTSTSGTSGNSTSGTAVRFAEVLQNTRLVKNMFNQAPFTTAVPLVNGKEIIGYQTISTSNSGFYVGRVIDEQERVGYSDPIYVDVNGVPK